MNQCGKAIRREMYESAFVRDNEGRTKIHFSSLRSRKLAHSAEATLASQSSLSNFSIRDGEKKKRSAFSREFFSISRRPTVNIKLRDVRPHSILHY